MYLNNLIMAMLYLDKDFNKTAKQYASATAQYSTYALFRTHATDMYLLAYHVTDNDNFNTQDPKQQKTLDRLKIRKDKTYPISTYVEYKEIMLMVVNLPHTCLD